MSKIYIFHFPNSLIHGVGEIDVKDKEKQDKSPEVQTPATFAPDIEAMPYLLLDIRDKDAFDKCHIIGGNIEALKGENCNQLMNQEATFMVSFIILCNPLFCCCQSPLLSLLLSPSYSLRHCFNNCRKSFFIP